jgi:hypothetical protein
MRKSKPISYSFQNKLRKIIRNLEQAEKELEKLADTGIVLDESITGVRITDLGTRNNNSYVVHNEGECKDGADRILFLSVLKHRAVISQGMTIGEPIYGN